MKINIRLLSQINGWILVALIVLKLFDIITWPWTWVLVPGYLAIGAAVIGFIIYTLVILRKGNKK